MAIEITTATEAQLSGIREALKTVGSIGNETINGIKTFISRPQVNGTGVLLSGEATALPSTLVYTTGDQTINGLKTFSSGITVTGGNIDLIGRNVSGVSNAVGGSVLMQGGFGYSTGGLLSMELARGGDISLIGGAAVSGGMLGTAGGSVKIIAGGPASINTLDLINGIDQPGSVILKGGPRANDPQGGAIVLRGNTYINPDQLARDFIIYKSGSNFPAPNFQVNRDRVDIYNDFVVYKSGNVAPAFAPINLKAGLDRVDINNHLYVSGETFANNINVSGTGIFNSIDLNNIDNLTLSGVDVTITSGVVNLTNRPRVNNTGVLLSGDSFLSTQILDSTSAGRSLLTGDRQAQRDALAIFATATNYNSLPTSGQTQRAYITNNDGRVYYWNGTTYVGISPASADVQINSVVNGDFSNLAGLGSDIGPDWRRNMPTGWNGDPNAGGGNLYSLYIAIQPYVVNVGNVSSGPSGNSFRQNLGILPITSNVTLTFTYSNPAGWSPPPPSTLNAAIYNNSFTTLATQSYSTPGTYTLTASSVAAGTTIIIGFWATQGAPGLSLVSASQTTESKTYILPTSLPRINSNLPSGALWIDTSAGNVLKIVI